MQDCSNSIANALELLQSYTKPSVYDLDRMGTLYSECHFIVAGSDNNVIGT